MSLKINAVQRCSTEVFSPSAQRSKSKVAECVKLLSLPDAGAMNGIGQIMKAKSPATVQVRFGKMVAMYRSKADLSQEQLAEKADVHRTYISGIECGHRNITIQVVGRLAEALRVSIADLFPPENFWNTATKPEAIGQ